MHTLYLNQHRNRKETRNKHSFEYSIPDKVIVVNAMKMARTIHMIICCYSWIQHCSVIFRHSYYNTKLRAYGIVFFLKRPNNVNIINLKSSYSLMTIMLNMHDTFATRHFKKQHSIDQLR